MSYLVEDTPGAWGEQRSQRIGLVMSEAIQLSPDIKTLHIVLSGFVQGVGFRPFVFHLADDLGVKGYVLNNAGQVSIIAEAAQQTLNIFRQRLIDNAPRYAQPVIQSVTEKKLNHYANFSIKSSHQLTESDVHIVPDLPVCEQCLNELFDKNSRRYLYPFINCSQCGPRYSIIQCLPYDRQNTSMHHFKFCRCCEKEYRAPADRRFHAEPVACENCGPVLNFVDYSRKISGNRQIGNRLALAACIRALNDGLIIAVKNVGGYHLICDATSPEAVARLRKSKQRADKPFAILMNRDRIEHYAEITRQQSDLLQSQARPVVLLRHRHKNDLAENLAPGFNNLGIMLPNNPLQHLICHFFKKPLVSTSANISGEPIMTDNKEAEQRLSSVCDAFLHHNRTIIRPVDDPVMMRNNFSTQVLRTGRGISPGEFSLPFSLEKPVLALGGHIKNTIALGWKNRLVVSSHNGDLSDFRSYRAYKQSIDDLQALYQVQAERLLCDAHPEYASSRRASQSSLPVTEIFHHCAHASSVCLDYPQIKHWLMFCWDGVGLGDVLGDAPSEGSEINQGNNAQLWGGEMFTGNAGRWQRVASFRPFRLPGGEKTAREAWRISASLCWHSQLNYQLKGDSDKQARLEQLKTVWDKKINSPESSAVGRLFSAAAAFLELLETESFEGHGPMLLESLADTALRSGVRFDALILPVATDEKGIARIDWQPLIHLLKDHTLSREQRAVCFHKTLAECVARLCIQFKTQEMAVGLSGGVFQNQLLLRLIKERLDKQGFTVYMPESIPLNDAGLSVGQIIEYHFQCAN